jgi:hypothetical protein
MAGPWPQEVEVSSIGQSTDTFDDTQTSSVTSHATSTPLIYHTSDDTQSPSVSSHATSTPLVNGTSADLFMSGALLPDVPKSSGGFLGWFGFRGPSASSGGKPKRAVSDDGRPDVVNDDHLPLTTAASVAPTPPNPRSPIRLP